MCLGIAVAVAFDPEFWKNQLGWNHQRNHEELLALHGELTLGLSQREVLTIVKSAHFPHLQVPRADLSSEEWWISTPLEFGAKNWTLSLQFADGRLSATRIRMADGDFHPSGAPTDQGQWKVRQSRKNLAY
jgi:hypothetical protein